MVEDPWQWGRDGESETRRGRLRRDSCDRWSHSVSVSVGSNANNGSQIHFGISSSMRVVSRVHSFKWFCPSCLPYGLKNTASASLFSSPLHYLPPSFCHLHQPPLSPSASRLPTSSRCLTPSAPPLIPHVLHVSFLSLSEMNVKSEIAAQHFFGWLLFSL